MEAPLLSRYFQACSQPTVSRFFDRVTNQTNVVFREQLIEMACKYINQNVADPIIDAELPVYIKAYVSKKTNAVGYSLSVQKEFKGPKRIQGEEF